MIRNIYFYIFVLFIKSFYYRFIIILLCISVTSLIARLLISSSPDKVADIATPDTNANAIYYFTFIAKSSFELLVVSLKNPSAKIFSARLLKLNIFCFDFNIFYQEFILISTYICIFIIF